MLHHVKFRPDDRSIAAVQQRLGNRESHGEQGFLDSEFSVNLDGIIKEQKHGNFITACELISTQAIGYKTVSINNLELTVTVPLAGGLFSHYSYRVGQLLSMQISLGERTGICMGLTSGSCSIGRQSGCTSQVL